MPEYIIQSLPSIVPLIMYFARLEIALAKLQTDVQWIKKSLNGYNVGPTFYTNWRCKEY